MINSPRAAELTIDRLFDAPALAGPTILSMQMSPDGSRVTYLQGKNDQKDMLDLWEHSIRDGQTRLLIDSKVLSPQAEKLSDDEAAKRERQRTAALSGILEYSFVPSGKALLFPLAGKLYYFELSSSTAPIVIAPSGGFVTDALASPSGRHVAYIRDQNLFVYDIASGQETAITRDGGGAIKNGMAEFIAQEEMGRSNGYWWSPQGRHLAFARVDESPVQVTQRIEIAAENISTFLQRYPAAGQSNALVKVGIADIYSGGITWIDLGSNEDIYVARVDWMPDGKTLAIQRESRDQRRLDLLFADTRTGKSRVVLTEISRTWIDLNDELSFLKHSHEFVWQSARTGYQHLYLYDYDGHLIRPLTSGEWNVDDFRQRAVKGINETHRTIYFSATEKSPTERHLYRTSLDTNDPTLMQRISHEPGLHSVTMSSDTHYYIDSFTSSAQPPRVRLLTAEGELKAALLENRLDATHPDAPYVEDNSVGEIGSMRAADGQILYYRLFKPAHFDHAKRYPAIIDVYGGPGVQRVVDNWSGSSFTQILTRAGYVVFQLDNRGTASRGSAFQDPIRGRLGNVEVADQVLGARWLASQGYVHESHVGVWGWSYGGYMSLMLMCKAPEIFSAGVAGAPVTDWSMYDTHYTERYLDTPLNHAAAYEASSVLSCAKQLKGKLLIMHGMADDNVLFLNSTKLFATLQSLGKPFDTMVYPGAKHGLLRQQDGRHAYAMILRFFDENLKP